jgi:nitroreductase
MNASSNAFRSHLMQQFAAQARTQSRPPLALLGLLSEDNSALSNPEAVSPTVIDASSHYVYQVSSIASSQTRSVNLQRRHTDSDVLTWSRRSSQLPPRHFSALAARDTDEESHPEEESPDLSSGLQFSLAFQNLLQTRRSISRFTPLTAPVPIVDEADYWRQALERAVLCGYQAPNHKRTEPFTFKRMIAPSVRTERLAEIAYLTSVRQHVVNNELKGNLSSQEEQQRKDQNVAAQRKREKWSRIPAFLVATVAEEESLESSLHLESSRLNSEYDQLPFLPPQTERALEDYASACAAVQNVLLSLHSEKIATKWVTGPVIRTRAFRDLIQADPTDRIVALIMVGQPAGRLSTHPRRHRRPLRSGGAHDVLIDL